jgi:hypothetical protein
MFSQGRRMIRAKATDPCRTSCWFFCRRGDFPPVRNCLCVLGGQKGLNTEVTEMLRALCVRVLGITEGTETPFLVAALPRCRNTKSPGVEARCHLL